MRSTRRNPWPRPVRKVARRALSPHAYDRYVGRHEAMSLAVWSSAVAQLAAGATVLDIGAFHGEFAVLARSARTDVRVVAFEPNPDSLVALRDECGPRQIDVVAAALSDVDGTVRFGLRGASSGMGTAGEDIPQIEVDAVRLDSLDLTGVSLVKIDVEGAEASVLRGGAETFARDRPMVLCEVLSDEWGAAVRDALPEGYAFMKIDENRGLRPVDAPGRWEWRNKNVLCVPLPRT